MGEGGLDFYLALGLAMCVWETAFLEEGASLKGCLSNQSRSQVPALQQEQTIAAYAAKAVINSGEAEDRGRHQGQGYSSTVFTT